MKIDNTVLDVLSNALIEGNSLRLSGQIARPLYVATNKVLELAGGKWNRKAQAHIFEGDAAEIMDQIILTCKVTDKKQELGYFPTPPDVVARLLELAGIESGMLVLEPSAGQGAIAYEASKVARAVDCVEVDAKNAECLIEAQAYRYVQQGDFLSITPIPLYHRVVMNPPFARQADIKHVLHALQFLASGGRLVSVMSSSVTFRTNKLAQAFREALKAHGGTIETLPENAFADSGTAVSTVIVAIGALDVVAP